MSHCILLVVLLMVPVPLWATESAEYHLYTPTPISSDKVGKSTPDNIFVKTVTVVGGDTLKKLARKYGGRSAFFPQILLFNSIKNPDLIHVGQKLRVPVKDVAASAPPARRESVARPIKKRPSAVRQKAALETSRKEKPVPEKVAGQALFARGLSAFRRGDFSSAESSFQEFLRRYPDSPLAPEAAVHLADSYLKRAPEEQ